MNLGDVVILNSDGAKMTVVGLDDAVEGVQVAWMDGEGNLDFAWLPKKCLRVIMRAEEPNAK